MNDRYAGMQSPSSRPAPNDDADKPGAKRFWLLAALAVLGLIYSVLATRYYVTHWVSLMPLMHRSLFMRMLLGPFWFSVQLAPITVVVALLRVRLGFAALLVLAYEVIMNAAVFAYAPWNFGEFIALLTFILWNFGFQVPVWWLTYLLTKRLGPVPT